MSGKDVAKGQDKSKAEDASQNGSKVAADKNAAVVEKEESAAKKEDSTAKKEGAADVTEGDATTAALESDAIKDAEDTK